VDELGKLTYNDTMDDFHIEEVLSLPLVNAELIKAANFRVAIDCVNSVGGLILPKLLKALGVNEVVELYCEPNGDFPHNPEPLPENLTDISEAVVKNKADIGFVVDPDVDRLAIVCEDGSMFGEEYTLVAVADYVLENTTGPTSSNLSSSKALSIITKNHGQNYFASAVGEVNVVEQMKIENCVIGGEGNGGIIYPELHYGRDALVGIALFLSHLAEKAIKCSELREKYPRLEMIKNKIEVDKNMNIDHLLSVLEKVYKDERVDVRDGLKIDFDHGWVHLRKSNTEPIIRVYSEATDKKQAEDLVSRIMIELEKIKF
jgi:phosphomannomutase